MKLTVKDSKKALDKTELVAVLSTEGSKLDLPKGVELAPSARKDFSGKFRKTRLSDALGGPAKRVLLVGLGKGDECDTERLRRATALALKAAKELELARLSIWIPGAVEKAVGGAEAAGLAAAEAAVMADYDCMRFKGKREAAKLENVALWGGGVGFGRGAKRGRALGEANVFVRDLQDAPGNHMRPRDLVAAARKLAGKSERIRFRSLDEAAMRKLGMGALLAVSQGSTEPAYLIHLSYRPKGKARGTIALVGKGLTFDAGGISLKPSAKMDQMKYDMSGGAAVLGVFHALASLDVPYEVHGIVPTSENLPDAKAVKPGDVVEAMNGTTIEVLNTDAEGRLILCDALCYTVEKVKPDTIIDLATLTGAVIVALGHELSGVMTNESELADALVASGEETGERVWPLPLLDCHKEQMKSKIADIKNINAGEGNGSTAGAAFLSNFVADIPWAHLDIAGSAWGGIERDYVGGPGGSGVGVRLLVHYLSNGA